ncbi:oxidoreductase, partial [Buttiauxella gaviniae]|uniref:oxidoreductase n=1 Tax=Buttiauxella gaviniae TaxID=82990 RepID=UPI0007E48432
KKALHPYADNLCIVTKVGARRDEKGGWLTAFTPQELVSAVEDNLCNLGLEVMEVVNLRSMLDIHQPKEGSLEPQLEAMIKLKERGLVRHIGLSNVTVKQVEDAQKLTPIACVQNMYNLANRHDDALVDKLAEQDIAYVPFFPLGGFSPLQSTQLDEIAADLQATPMQVALAWLLRRSPNILLIPGTSSPEHLQENLASARLNLSDEVMEKLNGMN